MTASNSKKENTMTDQREYPDPAERYEELHRDQREYDQDYDEYLNDCDAEMEKEND